MERIIHILAHSLAKRFVENHEDAKEFCTILISTPGDKTQNIEFIKSHVETLLHIEFDDVEIVRKGALAPTVSDIRNVLEWAREKKKLLVSCSAGVSRSAAIAYLIHCLDKPPKEAIQHLKIGIHDPNKVVIKLGAEVLNNPEVESVIADFHDEALSLLYG